MKKKLHLRSWVKVTLFYIIVALITYLITLRIDQLISWGY